MQSTGNLNFQIQTSAFEYVLLILISLGLASFFLFLSGGLLPVFWLLMLLPLLGVIYGLSGLIRPRSIDFSDEQMTIRPVWGAGKVISKSCINGFEDYVSPPFGELVVRFRDVRGRERALTLRKRLALSGLGVREKGREVGVISSATLRAVSAWLD